MDPEEERIRLLTRLGRETIIKRGTYDMDKSRTIIQDHPFYPQPSIEEQEEAAMFEEPEMILPEEVEAMPEAPFEPVSEEDAAALAAQIMGNNFKTGMSQEDVDVFLKGLI